MHDIKQIATTIKAYPKSPYYHNIFVVNEEALGRTLLRSDVKNGNVVLKAKEMSAADIMYLSVTQDLFAHLITPDEKGTILVQPTCNADKSKFDLREVCLKKIKVGTTTDAFDLLKTVATEFRYSAGI
jgi:hypothetical protein